MTRNYFKAISKVSRALGSTLKKEEILKLIVQSAKEAMNVKGAALYLPIEDRLDKYEAAAFVGLSKHYAETVIEALPDSASIMQKEGHICFRNATTDPRAYNHALKKQEGIVSLLSVPAMAKGKYIGILCLYTGRERIFSEHEIEFATVMAEHGAMAIELARILEKVRNANRLILKVASSLNTSLDLHDILKNTMQVFATDVTQALGVKAATVRLLDKDQKTLNLVASYGLSDKYLNKGPISAEKSIAEALKGKAVVVEDASRDEGVQYRKEKIEEGIATILCVPIKAREEVIGVLRLYTAAPRKFNEDEIMDVTALASLGGLPIHNAGLYMMLKKDFKELKDDIWSHHKWF